MGDWSGARKRLSEEGRPQTPTGDNLGRRPYEPGTSDYPTGPEEAQVLGYPRGATVADSPPRIGRRLREFSALKERCAEPGARSGSFRSHAIAVRPAGPSIPEVMTVPTHLGSA